MELKVKLLNWSAGRPVAILNKEFAEKASLHLDERIAIRKNSKKLVCVVDIATSLLNENEIVVSTEISQTLKLKKNDIVGIEIAPKPKSTSFILKKFNGLSLNKKEIEAIITDIVHNALTEAEVAYFVSAVYKGGMSLKETEYLTEAIVKTGQKLEFKKITADKHSIGGIPGRTTPIIVSICASAGLVIPKTSSRAITTPSGTADAMETVCKVNFTADELKKIIEKTNACMVWGGSLGLAPADDKIIRVERLLNIDPEPQLLASIMAKKIAVDANYVLIHLPYGKGAKVNKKQAKHLEKKFLQLARHFNIRLRCFLSEVKEPFGNGIGPALEMKDVIKVLKKESPCHLLEKKSLELAGQLLELSGKTKKGNGIKKAKEILDSGQAFKKFQEIVKAQRGNINRVNKIKAKFHHDIRAQNNSKIKEIKIQKINNLARVAGCPLDKSAGLYLYKHVGDKVKKGEKILTIYSESKPELNEAIEYYKKTKPIVY